MTADALPEGREARLEHLGYPLDRTTPEGTLVDAVAICGPWVYVSGHVPFDGELLVSAGHVPDDIPLTEARTAAALCAANALRAVRRQVGSLDRIARVVRVTGYVAASPGFTDAHRVIDGASELLLAVFGTAGRHARTALGVAQLPLGASTEIEMILLLEGTW